MVNGAGYGAGVNGQQAFQFNGVNQYMSAPRIRFRLRDQLFLHWTMGQFFGDQYRTDHECTECFIANTDGAGDLNKWIFFYDGAGHLVFHINSPASGPIFLSSPMTFTPLVVAWNYYSVTDIDGTYTFYADGNSLGS